MSEPKQHQSQESDSWTIWFSRFLQIIGVGTFLEQLIVGQGDADRPWILLIALAMMLGGLGLQMLLRALTRIGNGT